MYPTFISATEFRAWLLYYSVPVLKGILHHTYLQHYSLLVSAMALLVGEKITPDELTEADNLIDLFCKELAFHYGEFVPRHLQEYQGLCPVSVT